MNVIERDSAHGELVLSPHDVMTAADHAPLSLTKGTRGGSVVVRYSRVERWDVIDDRPEQAWWHPARLKLVIAALGGIGIGAAVALAFSGHSNMPVKARDASIALSSAVAEIPPVLAPVRTRSVPVTAPPRARTAIVRGAASAPVATPAAAIERATGPDSEAAALAQAFSTDEAVSWRGPANTGTVVVGTAAIENGRYCRDVAILTRAEGAADRTVNGRKCLEPGGRITDQPAPAPQ